MGAVVALGVGFKRRRA
ncbi:MULTISPECIES: hypothetical protein [Microcystis]|nr:MULTISPECIES: hypothetical protein [Microcystis]